MEALTARASHAGRTRPHPTHRPEQPHVRGAMYALESLVR